MIEQTASFPLYTTLIFSPTYFFSSSGGYFVVDVKSRESHTIAHQRVLHVNNPKTLDWLDQFDLSLALFRLILDGLREVESASAHGIIKNNHPSISGMFTCARV